MVLVVDHVVAAAANRLVCFILLSPQCDQDGRPQSQTLFGHFGPTRFDRGVVEVGQFSPGSWTAQIGGQPAESRSFTPRWAGNRAGPAEQVAGYGVATPRCRKSNRSPHELLAVLACLARSVSTIFGLSLKIEEPLTMAS